MRTWSDLLKDFLRAEDHKDPYVWGAVFLAHAFIGAAGWVFLGMGVVPVYLVILAAQGMIAGKLDVTDAAFDLIATAGGGLLALSIASGVRADTFAALGLIVLLGVIGVTIKLKQWGD